MMQLLGKKFLSIFVMNSNRKRKFVYDMMTFALCVSLQIQSISQKEKERSDDHTQSYISIMWMDEENRKTQKVISQIIVHKHLLLCTKTVFKVELNEKEKTKISKTTKWIE